MTSLASELYRNEMAQLWANSEVRDLDLRTKRARELITDSYRKQTSEYLSNPSRQRR